MAVFGLPLRTVTTPTAQLPPLAMRIASVPTSCSVDAGDPFRVSTGEVVASAPVAGDSDHGDATTSCHACSKPPTMGDLVSDRTVRASSRAFRLCDEIHSRPKEIGSGRRT